MLIAHKSTEIFLSSQNLYQFSQVIENFQHSFTLRIFYTSGSMRCMKVNERENFSKSQQMRTTQPNATRHGIRMLNATQRIHMNNGLSVLPNSQRESNRILRRNGFSTCEPTIQFRITLHRTCMCMCAFVPKRSSNVSFENELF